MSVLKMCVLLRYFIVAGLIAFGSSQPDNQNSDITFVKIKPVASGAPIIAQNRHSRQDSNSTGEDLTSNPSIKPQDTSAAPAALDTDRLVRNASTTETLDDSVNIEATTATMINSVKSTLYIQTPTTNNANDGILNSARDSSHEVAPLPIPRQDQNVNYRESSIITVKPIVSIPKSKKRVVEVLRPSKRYINLDGTSKNSNPNNLHHIAVHRKKGYKSKCRCSRIWNCPKLQISVPRCLPDYYMCCF